MVYDIEWKDEQGDTYEASFKDIQEAKEEIRKIIFELVKLFIYTQNYEGKKIEKSLLDFSKNIEKIVDKDFSELTKNRATMMLIELLSI